MIIPYFILWKWTKAGYRSPYTSAHVETLCMMLRRHGVPFEKIICVTDDPSGIVSCRTHPLWSDHATLNNASGQHLPSCYRRLKLFDRATQVNMGIPEGERVVSIDLDTVITQLDFMALFQRKDKPYVGWLVPGTRHRVVMNGSMWMFTAGEMQWLWDEFDPKNSPMQALRHGYMGSDQGYLSWRLIGNKNLGGWTAVEHGVLSYTRDVRAFKRLPKTARVVFFAGKVKPWMPEAIRHSTWITRYTTPDFVEPLKEIA